MSANRHVSAASSWDAAAIVPSDVTVIPTTRVGIYVGVAGNLRVRMADSGNIVTFNAVPVGILPVQVDQVLATSTTATTMLALY